jgi:hypothetical protein
VSDVVSALLDILQVGTSVGDCLQGMLASADTTACCCVVAVQSLYLATDALPLGLVHAVAGTVLACGAPVLVFNDWSPRWPALL